MKNIEGIPSYCDSHKHHISETPVFVGCDVRAVGANESNTYRRTEREKTVFRSVDEHDLQNWTSGGRALAQGAGDAGWRRRNVRMRLMLLLNS